MRAGCILLLSGPPYIRATGPLKAVAGEPLQMHCPFSGYPIESIKWEKARQEIATSKQQVQTIRVFVHNLKKQFFFPDSRYEVVSAASGGYLRIHKIDSSQDDGVYTCIVRSRTGEEARRDMQLTVNSKYTGRRCFL